MTTMNAFKLKELIETYRGDSVRTAIAGVPARGKTATDRAKALASLPTQAELDAQRAAIHAEISRLYSTLDDAYPQEMIHMFCEATQAIVNQAQGMLIEAVAEGADGPAVAATAALFCKYNEAVNAMVLFAKERAAKKLYAWAPLAVFGGIGALLLAGYLGNRKKLRAK